MLHGKGLLTPIQTYVEFILTLDEESLKVDLAQDSPFQLKPPAQAEAGIWVSSLPDLRVDKLLAYFGRAEPRDAVDLYFIFQQAPLDELKLWSRGCAVG